jgi:hypothetical protein
MSSSKKTHWLSAAYIAVMMMIWLAIIAVSLAETGCSGRERSLASAVDIHVGYIGSTPQAQEDGSWTCLNGNGAGLEGHGVRHFRGHLAVGTAKCFAAQTAYVLLRSRVIPPMQAEGWRTPKASKEYGPGAVWPYRTALWPLPALRRLARKSTGLTRSDLRSSSVSVSQGIRRLPSIEDPRSRRGYRRGNARRQPLGRWRNGNAMGFTRPMNAGSSPALPTA